MGRLDELGGDLAAMSRWIDNHNIAQGKAPESIAWGRIAKVTEEAGESVAAMILWTGQNPRKPASGSANDVIAELLDVAVTALGAVEHLTGNHGLSMDLLVEKIDKIIGRAHEWGMTE